MGRLRLGISGLGRKITDRKQAARNIKTKNIKAPPPAKIRNLELVNRSIGYILIALVGCLFYARMAAAEKETLVYLEYSETLSFDEEKHPDTQLLKGNVRFRHEDALMYCDSAYFYEKTNSLDAFGHVRLLQGDTIAGYGDVLYYDGNSRFARLRNNVRLVHTGTTLTTDSLNYDRRQNIAWYFTGGTIQDSLNTLTSRWGQYTPYNHTALFKTDVRLVNKQFVLTSDTLCYNTQTNIANLVGATHIVYEEETDIYSTLGWYNTRTEESMLLRHSRIVHSDGKSLTGDTIFYDKQKGLGRVHRHMEMRDTIQKASLYGNYGEMYEDSKSGFATDSAMFVDWSEDDYLYMHADTLRTEEIPYRIFRLLERDSLLVDSVLTAQAPDTIWQDTTYRQVRAFYGVRVWRRDLQAVCDSISYNLRDSVMQMMGVPVCWSDNQQLSADRIDIYMKNGTVDYIHGVGGSTAVQKENLEQFNQLSGKEMFAYVRDGELYRIDVNGNAETVFYPKEEDDGEVIGVNRTQSSYVKLYITDQKIDHILFTTATSGTMYPLDEASESITRLAGFFWADSARPVSQNDIFRKTEQVNKPEQKAISATDGEEEKQSEKKNENKGGGKTRKKEKP